MPSVFLQTLQISQYLIEFSYRYRRLVLSLKRGWALSVHGFAKGRQRVSHSRMRHASVALAPEILETLKPWHLRQENGLQFCNGVTFCGRFGQKILPSKTFPAVD